jgi:hypothetical protein
MKTIIAWLTRLQSEQITPVVVATASTTITRAQAVRGVVVSNAGASGAVTFALPKAEPGLQVTAVVKAAQELRLDPNGTETLALPSSGVQQAAGKYITADALGESATYVCIVKGTWDYVGPIDGTWTVEA